MAEILYASTRGNSGKLSFGQSVMMGLGEDGGLIVPEKFPFFTQQDFETMVDLPYHHVAYIVLRMFGINIPGPVLWDMVRKAYNPYVFKNVSDGDIALDIAPVRNIGGNRYLVRLSNGPSLAFKDFALQLLGFLYEYFLQGAFLNVLGATSGDTGTAAILALLRRLGIRVFILSPLYGMSTFQAPHMRSVDDPMIFNIAIEGCFDDCQKPIKTIFRDLDFKKKYNLGAVNSINLARVFAQIVYYVWAYLKVSGTTGNEVDVAVPSGNFGNVCAADFARKMGVPIRKLILATNANDVLHEFFLTGIYQPRANTVVTSSPSMDITAASNFERYIYYLFGGDAQKVCELWSELDATGSINLTRYMSDIRATNIVSESVTETQCHNAIGHTYDSQGIIIDPHTAVAMHATFVHQKNDGVPVLVMETAQPCKFDETIQKVLGKPAPRPPEFEGIEKRLQKYTVLPPNPEAIKDFIKANVD